MKFINTFLLLFITLYISYSPQQAVAHGHQSHANNLEKACQHAGHKDSCISMLQSDPNSHSSDVKGLTLIALRLASSNASDISEHIKVLLNDSSLDPAVQDGLSECLEYYLDAAEQLDDSVAALLANAYKDVEAWVNVAIIDAASCDSALDGHEFVLGGKTDAFRGLCDNALAIIKVLANNEK
ncbi:Putative invertase inhibitor [Morus notabilis]|uniref:Putative invertase inhibitor n=1 Tax=Morus notabilis TaxID=981085 RepID=W9QQ78_9ROSA|nr:uncharacterized protein LOC21394387 [Morus notabilis]EXB33523.1 Putative invertase inhibitor [Morus notabilis]